METEDPVRASLLRIQYGAREEKEEAALEKSVREHRVVKLVDGFTEVHISNIHDGATQEIVLEACRRAYQARLAREQPRNLQKWKLQARTRSAIKIHLADVSGVVELLRSEDPDNPHCWSHHCTFNTQRGHIAGTGRERRGAPSQPDSAPQERQAAALGRGLCDVHEHLRVQDAAGGQWYTAAQLCTARVSTPRSARRTQQPPAAREGPAQDHGESSAAGRRVRGARPRQHCLPRRRRAQVL
jgi:hypothetical protein